MSRPRDAGRQIGRALATVLAGALLAGCGAGAGGSRSPEGPSLMPSSITATATVTPAAPTAVPLPTPSEEPTATPAPLPAAVLETVDGFVAGTLGSYGIDGRGGDAPWLPFDSLPVVTLASGGIVVARLVDGVAIGQAIAVVAAQDDAAGLHLREVMVEMIGASADKVTIGPLPAGSWVLAVRLFRADGRGDGQTYWAVTVP